MPSATFPSSTGFLGHDTPGAADGKALAMAAADRPWPYKHQGNKSEDLGRSRCTDAWEAGEVKAWGERKPEILATHQYREAAFDSGSMRAACVPSELRARGTCSPSSEGSRRPGPLA